jgi:hypothetical protein
VNANSQPNGSSSSPPNPVPAQQPERPTTPPLPSQPPAAKPPTSLKYEPYTAQRALALFAKYADSDDPNVIGPEGFEALCTDAGIPLDGALPLILAWQLNAQEMAKISKDEWVKGMATLKCVLILFSMNEPHTDARFTSAVQNCLFTRVIHCFDRSSEPFDSSARGSAETGWEEG